jgi:quinol monooxygenase YgiN
MSGTPSMLIVHVHVHVKPGTEQPFRAASLANAEASRREPGVVRFDLLEDREDPLRFLLVEVYRDSSAAAAHKDTSHYAAWRDAVAELMAEPRRSTKYVNVSPGDAGW